MSKTIQRVYYINSNNNDNITIKVGKTNMVDGNIPASVINSGTDKNIILDFNIPKSTVIMPTLKVGKVKIGKQLEASITGLPPNFILNLTLPEQK